jgi:hypothetical protein
MAVQRDKQRVGKLVERKVELLVGYSESRWVAMKVVNLVD